MFQSEQPTGLKQTNHKIYKVFCFVHGENPAFRFDLSVYDLKAWAGPERQPLGSRIRRTSNQGLSARQCTGHDPQKIVVSSCMYRFDPPKFSAAKRGNPKKNSTKYNTHTGRKNIYIYTMTTVSPRVKLQCWDVNVCARMCTMFLDITIFSGVLKFVILTRPIASQ